MTELDRRGMIVDLMRHVHGLLDMADRQELLYANPRTGNTRPLSLQGVAASARSVQEAFGVGLAELTEQWDDEDEKQS